jgi:hypothetical protein
VADFLSRIQIGYPRMKLFKLPPFGLGLSGEPRLRESWALAKSV